MKLDLEYYKKLCGTEMISFTNRWYAGIKFKGLIVTNDEMTDHLFQLLGNDVFPRKASSELSSFGNNNFLSYLFTY